MSKIFFKSALLFAASVSSSAWAQTVYVENNRADGNSLLPFDLGIDGSLTAKAAVSTGGKGVVDPSFALGPFDSDQEIITNSERTLLFSVNSGSNSIAVFQIAKNGTLKPVPGSPFDSHGINPVSLGLKGKILTVVNKHGDPAQSTNASLPNYTTFFVSRGGSLHWTGSSFDAENGSSPSQALVSPFAPLIFGADFLGGLVRSFELGPYGTLHSSSAVQPPASEFPDAKTPRLPLGLAAHPSRPFVYVGLPTANKIAVYTYDRWGHLNFRRAVPDSGMVVCWLITNRAGTRLYASNTGDASITVYDISAHPDQPSEIQKFALPSKGNSFQLTLNQDETKLLVLTQRFQASTPLGQGNEIHVLDVHPYDGKVSSAQGSSTILNLPGDTRPQGILVN